MADDAKTLCQPACSAEAIEETIKDSPTIKGLEQKDKEIIREIVKVEWDVTNINNKITQINNNITNIKNINNEQSIEIWEINDNITMIKSWNHKQEQIIEGMKAKVIIDHIYNNFDEWCENVYIPQAYHIKNKFSMGDIYINVCASRTATNATYVNIRNENKVNEFSANDWQELYYSAPADVLVAIGIDPIVVTHPYKHEWVISLQKERFADFISQLEYLDLTKVDVSLWDVYFNPVFKESITIQENLNVGDTINTKNLNVKHDATINHAEIKNACIHNMVCDTTFKRNVTVKGWMVIQNNLNVKGNSEVTNLHVSGHVHFPDETHIKIDGINLSAWLEQYVQVHGCIDANTTTDVVNPGQQIIFEMMPGGAAGWPTTP